MPSYEDSTPRTKGRAAVTTVLLSFVLLGAILVGYLLGRDQGSGPPTGARSSEMDVAEMEASPPTGRRGSSTHHVGEAADADAMHPSEEGGASSTSPHEPGDGEDGAGPSREETYRAGSPARAEEPGRRRSSGTDSFREGPPLPYAAPAAPGFRTPERSSTGSTPGPPGSSAIPAAPPSSDSPRTPSESGDEGGRDPGETPPAPVEDRDSDRHAPVLGSLRFDPPEGADGDVVSLLIQVTDDLSGVRSVSGFVRSPSGIAILPFEAQGESGGGGFTASFKIPSAAEAGDWYVSNLLVYDRANNPLIGAFSAATAPAGGRLHVTSRDSDSTAPEVRSVSMEKGTIAGGEKNLIRVEAVDDRSGTASITGAFQGPSKSGLLWFVCRLNTESDLWEGEMALPVNAECGQWTIQHIRITDNAGNVGFPPRDSSALARASFEVSSPEHCDSTPPTLEGLDLSPTIVSNEAAAEILVTASVRDEGSGTSSVSGWAVGPTATNGQAPRIHFSCAKDSRDSEAPWIGRLLVPQYAAKGVWKVGWMRLQDRALNARDYKGEDPVLAGAIFRVE